MNTDNAAMLESHIEKALARLPEWETPPEFAARLAAAAARQTATPVEIPPAPAWNELVPVVLSSIGLATVLAWVVPWSRLTGDTLVWTCVVAMSAAGAVTTLRVLRAP